MAEHLAFNQRAVGSSPTRPIERKRKVTKEGPPGGGPAPRVCPAWAMVRRWKSSRNLVVGTEASRKAPTARGALKEAG